MTWHRVASSDEAANVRRWLPVSAAGEHIALTRQDEEWFAVQDRCTHAGCPFSEEASIEDGRIVCNCHGSEFDLRSGEVLRGPAEYPVRTFHVRMSGEGLEVEV
jgi:nitrite reductase/ring-hydroxylating ferredoxin subunit